MNSIQAGCDGCNQGDALTLPKNGAQAIKNLNVGAKTTEQQRTRTELARQWLADFDHWTQTSYDTARDGAHTLERFLQPAAPIATEAAHKLTIMPAFPFPTREAGQFVQVDEMSNRVDALTRGLRVVLFSSRTNEIEELLRFWALHLLRAQFAQFAEELKEAAWFGLGDEHAKNETPMFYALFEKYLEHSGRADELKADGLLICEVLTGEPDERTPAYFVEVWEEELVKLYDEKRDRLSVVIRTLPQHARPNITAEEVEADRTLGLVVQHWEREHAPTWNALQTEKVQLEAWLATEGLEKAYWWARGVDQGISVGREDDCDPLKPTFALLLDYWREKGIAGEGITVDDFFTAYFQDDKDDV